jgi:hypothetical protein
LLQGAGQAAVEGAVGTALPMAGAKAVGATGRLMGMGNQAVAAKLPQTAEELGDISRGHT